MGSKYALLPLLPLPRTFFLSSIARARLLPHLHVFKFHALSHQSQNALPSLEVKLDEFFQSLFNEGSNQILSCSQFPFACLLIASRCDFSILVSHVKARKTHKPRAPLIGSFTQTVRNTTLSRPFVRSAGLIVPIRAYKTL